MNEKTGEFDFVVIEVPFSGDRDRDTDYLNRVLRECSIERGEIYWSRAKLLVDGVLDDGDEMERGLSIRQGNAAAIELWRKHKAPRVFYIDHGMDAEMEAAAHHASKNDQRTVFRKLGDPLELTNVIGAVE